MTGGRAASRDQRGACLVLALLAAGTLQVARRWADAQFWNCVVDTTVTVAGAAILFWIGRRDPVRGPHLPARLAISLAGFLILPVIVEMVLRSLAEEGEAFELVMLVCLRNAALGTAAFARRRGQARLSCVFSGFLTLFSVSISDGRFIYVPAAIFSVVGLWTLMGAYWDRLQGQLAVECRRQAPVRIGVLGAVCGILAVSAGLVAGVRHDLIALPGFMPTSGGQQASDPYARQGIGDGDMLAAAKEQAMTFGPVDSEQFLESNMPSLYDMLDDRYGEPTVKPRRVQRAVALSGSKSSDPNLKPGQSKQSGREFAAARRKMRNKPLRPRDTESKALLYVLGAVPVHLSLETYDAFDGATWVHEAGHPVTPPLALNAAGDRPWLEFSASPSRWVLAQERHAVKIVNLRSLRFPSPPLLTAVHIDRVNRADMFRWTPDGVLQIVGQDAVPQFTVVHLVNNVLSSDAVRKGGLREPVAAENAPYLRLPDVASLAECKRLAEAWTAGVPPGWPQVEAVVARLRSEFVHDNDSFAPAGCPDVIGHFLSRRRGPDYLFASAAAVLLRSCGYPTRLVSGFYADGKRYDRRAGQTAVIKDDAHVWVEVGVSRGTWVSVEPTPGYEPPRMVRTWRERAWMLVASLGGWILARWPFACGIVLIASIGVWRRRPLADAIACLIWRGCLLGGPQRAVLATVRLLERRARLAGCSRPENKTLAAWHGRWLRDCVSLRSKSHVSESRVFESHSPESHGPDSASQVMVLIDWVLYAPHRGGESPLPATEVKQVCRDAVRSASLKTMRQARVGSRPAI
jgi:hypothetical protein